MAANNLFTSLQGDLSMLNLTVNTTVHKSDSRVQAVATIKQLFDTILAKLTRLEDSREKQIAALEHLLKKDAKDTEDVGTLTDNLVNKKPRELGCLRKNDLQLSVEMVRLNWFTPLRQDLITLNTQVNSTVLNKCVQKEDVKNRINQLFLPLRRKVDHLQYTRQNMIASMQQQLTGASKREEVGTNTEPTDFYDDLSEEEILVLTVDECMYDLLKQVELNCAVIEQPEEQLGTDLASKPETDTKPIGQSTNVPIATAGSPKKEELGKSTSNLDMKLGDSSSEGTKPIDESASHLDTKSIGESADYLDTKLTGESAGNLDMTPIGESQEEQDEKHYDSADDYAAMDREFEDEFGFRSRDPTKRDISGPSSAKKRREGDQ